MQLVVFDHDAVVRLCSVELCRFWSWWSSLLGLDKLEECHQMVKSRSEGVSLHPAINAKWLILS